MTNAYAVHLMSSLGIALAAVVGHCAIKATVLLAAAGLTVCLVRRRSACWRHAVWLSAIVTILLLPLAVCLLPTWHALPAWHRATVRFDPSVVVPAPRADLELVAHQVAPLPHVESVLPFPSPRAENAPTATADTPRSTPRLQPAQASDGSDAQDLSGACETAARDGVAEPRLASIGLSAVWLAGVLLCALRLGVSALRLHRLEGLSRALFSGPLWDIHESVRRQLAVSGPVRLLLGPVGTSPMAWGIRRPCILLPAGAEHWNAQRQRAVITHEMSHVCRHDALTSCLVNVAEMTYWFHPLVWFAARQIGREREQACDDLVVRSGMRATDYAEHLLRVAASLGQPRRPGVLGLAMSRAGQLEVRLLALLDRDANRRSARRGTLMATAGAWLCLSLPLAMLRAELPHDLPPVAPESTIRTSETTIPARVGYVDDTAEGRRSIAGSGHAVQFERPPQARYVMAVEIYASRYGLADPPAEDFHLYLLDENHQLLQAIPFPYSMIERGEPRWYTLRVPAVKVPKRFLLALSFNPHQSKGIYLGLDDSVKRSHSFTGRPTQGYEPVAQAYDWMIRAVLVRQIPVTSPFEESATD